MSEFNILITALLNDMNVISEDLRKASEGNATAAKRARIWLISLERLAKIYRRDSIKYFKEQAKMRQILRSRGKGMSRVNELFDLED